MVATHYYSLESQPFMNILSASETVRCALIEQLAHNKNKVCNRFRNAKWYIQERSKLENWMYEEFIRIGGKPRVRHPQYLVLGKSDYLESCYGEDCGYITVDLNDISPMEVSFTICDSLAMFVTEDIDNKLYKKEEIIAYMQENTITPEKIDEQRKYIEVQIWNDSEKSFVRT